MSETGTSRRPALWAAKVAAELRRADSEIPGAGLVAWSGNPLGSIMLVKGEAGPAEESGGPALSGADGDAADAALRALGIDSARAFKTLSRAARAVEPERGQARLLRQIEAVDPQAIVALDPDAAVDVAAALGTHRLVAGRPVDHHGRTIIAIEGLERSLTDPRLKRRVWAQFKHLSFAGPVW